MKEKRKQINQDPNKDQLVKLVKAAEEKSNVTGKDLKKIFEETFGEMFTEKYEQAIFLNIANTGQDIYIVNLN